MYDYTDPVAVHTLLTGLSQGFKIGYQGPHIPKEYSNLLSAKDNPSIISRNILKEVQLGHTAGPFTSLPFPNLQDYPIRVVPKKHSSDWRTIFHLLHPKHHFTSVNVHISPDEYSLHCTTVDNVISIIQKLGQGVLCLSWTSSLPSVIFQSIRLTGSVILLLTVG